MPQSRAPAPRGPDSLTGPGGEQLITGVTHDSRRARPGDLYAALAGGHAHGAQFCSQAAAAGVLPAAVGLAGAVPVVAWRRRRPSDDD